MLLKKKKKKRKKRKKGRKTRGRKKSRGWGGEHSNHNLQLLFGNLTKLSMSHCLILCFVLEYFIYTVLSIKKYETQGVYLPEPTGMNSPVVLNMNFD